MNWRGHELTGSSSDQYKSQFCIMIKTKELIPFTSMWRTSHLSLGPLVGQKNQTITHLRHFSSSLFISLLLFSWVPVSAEVPGTVCTMFSLICLVLLSGSLTTETKPNLTKQATEEYLKKATELYVHCINERPFRRKFSCLHKQKWLTFHVVACFWASLLPPNYMLVKDRARRSQPLYSLHKSANKNFHFLVYFNYLWYLVWTNTLLGLNLEAKREKKWHNKSFKLGNTRLENRGRFSYHAFVG